MKSVNLISKADPVARVARNCSEILYYDRIRTDKPESHCERLTVRPGRVRIYRRIRFDLQRMGILCGMASWAKEHEERLTCHWQHWAVLDMFSSLPYGVERNAYRTQRSRCGYHCVQS